MKQLDTKLIESALQLTGKNMYDVSFDEMQSDGMFKTELSIEKFYAFLLSPEFIEKYNTDYCDIINCDKSYTAMSFGFAIHDYQSGNEQPLIELLSKIGAK